MKRLFLIGLIFGLFLSHGYAQMADQKAEMGKGMMGQKEMMDKVIEMMNQMSEMMAKMPNLMTRVAPPPDTEKMMFEIMKDMSKQIMDMSKIIEKGVASKKEMNLMQDKLAQMKRKISGIEMK